MRRLAIAAAGLMLCLLPIAGEAQAQGIPGGMRRGAVEGDRVAGPIGGIVGGAVGGAVGGVNGVLGIDPGRRAYRTRMRSHRHDYRSRHHRRDHRGHRYR
ncbi:Carboxylesterase [Methylorubrum aminovorans]